MSETDNTTTLEDVDNVLSTVGKPRLGGCLYANFDPDNCVLPTDAVTDIKSLPGWVSLGDLTTDGVNYPRDTSQTVLRGYQGDVVAVETSETTGKISFVLIEPNRPAAAELYYGKGNVTIGDDGSVASIRDMLVSGVDVALCEDGLESNGYLRRVVSPKATIHTFEEVKHASASLVTYGATGTLIKKANKPAKYIYRAKPATV